ncbi:AAA family ATPase [Mycoplasmopsis agalactiae]|nr:AAA family ATPase [Mycoplasmopsis agalactiae]
MFMSNESNSGAIRLKGKFLVVKWSGADNNIPRELWIFESSPERERFFIYTNKQEIKSSCFYEIEVKLRASKRSKYQNSTYELLSFKIVSPDNDSDIEKMLVSNVAGLGVKGIQRIKSELGLSSIKELFDDVESAQNVLKTAIYENLKAFINSFDQKDYDFFAENGLLKLYDKLRARFENNDFVSRYKNNGDPYELYVDHWIDFKLVDLFAQCVNKNIEPYKIIRAFTYKILRTNFNNICTMYYDVLPFYKSLWNWYEDYRRDNSENSTLFEQSYVVSLLSLLLQKRDISDDLIIESLNVMIQRGEVYFDSDSKRLSLNEVYEQELFVAKKLIKIRDSELKQQVIPLPSQKLADEQKKAYASALNNPLSVITGYPGTGKSYLIAYIVETLLKDKHYKKKDIAVLTPTGRASTILAYKTGIEARTIHSFLKLSKSDEDDSFIESFEKENPIKVVVIDEFSMVSLPIMYELLKTCTSIERLILVGDRDQLPCIGKGNLLEDIINSKKFPTFVLKEIHRTDKIDIFKHFIAINDNKVPKIDTENVKFIEQNGIQFLNNIVKIYEEKVNKYSIDNVIILLPSYLELGQPGINEVNKRLQEWNIKRTGAKKNLSIHNNLTLFVGDRVIQTVNDYDKNVFNGEIGIVEEINTDSKNTFIIVGFGQDKKVRYNRSEILENLSLAYAITVHKFQGSEASCVIFGILKNRVEHMFTKKFMYTAVSRAKEELLLLGSKDLYIQKIQSRNADLKHYTNLKLLIEKEAK